MHAHPCLERDQGAPHTLRGHPLHNVRHVFQLQALQPADDVHLMGIRGAGGEREPRHSGEVTKRRCLETRRNAEVEVSIWV
jgi:hypothetical protein